MIKKEVIKEIKKILGNENVLETPEDRLTHSYDASRQSAEPDLVIKPGTAEEISALLKLASEHNIPMVPRGAGSGLTGGSVPVKGGIVVDLARMDRIISISQEDLMAVVEPGVVASDLQKKLEARGLFYPPDPASAEFCTIGGNVAECAGGLRCIKYGVTRDYVMGLEVVLPNGEIIHTGSHTLKSVTGYDLTRLFVGSEGTLGIFTRITLRLIPKPQKIETILSFFDDPAKALNVTTKIMELGILPRALEFMDESSIKAVQNYSQEFKLPTGTRSLLLIEVDGEPSEVTSQAKKIVAYLEKADTIKTMRAKDEAEAQYLWSIRKIISPALYSITAKKISEDISLPRTQLVPMLESIRRIESTYNIPMASFGHAGDGNLHVNFLVSTSEQENKLPGAIKELFASTMKLKGTLSGEHGIGLTKAHYLEMEIPPTELKLMKEIKKLFDPKDIMNPGKIF
ncbi:MAG: FAD-binding protein [Planctomycetes bacterium]|nr:FAD-binding protein [Planctomycetota bacterium]